ncbi:MAG TPA: S41 family peptidase, partial [Chloroflexia bacterium]|nr:S41 family peptidase [Chloroflexia bacterium]
SVVFKETGHRLGGLFLQYWQKNGGLAQQGFPISDEFQEKSPTDGKTYTVQYFERAVFEAHPENKAPYNVLLSLLGTQQLQARYGTIGAPPANLLSAQQRIDLLDAVWKRVRDSYVYTDFRGLDWQATYNEYKAKISAAAGDADAYQVVSDMIEKLGDKHSSFLNPEQAAEDDALRQGDLKLSGIGVLSQEIDGAVRIVYVIPGGPADKAGLLAFDIIRAVDGKPLTSAEDAPRVIRGPPGTSVKLTIETPGKAPRDVTVVRETVTFAFHAQARRWAGTNVAYVNLPTFNSSGISQEVASEIQRLAAAGPLEGVIIDLRQNSGGLISELNATLALFINGGSAGYDVTRAGRSEYRIPAGRVLPSVQGKPVVVLVSKASVSASERFAAVMQDHGRATILGTTTAGNTETVYPYDMPFGSRLMLAQATYLRTDGKSTLEDIGVIPEIVLDVPWYQYPADQDPQILAAVKRVQGK